VLGAYASNLCPLRIRQQSTFACCWLCNRKGTRGGKRRKGWARSALARVPCCLCVAYANNRQRYFAGRCAPGISCLHFFLPCCLCVAYANNRQRYFAGSCAAGISCVAKSQAQVATSKGSLSTFSLASKYRASHKQGRQPLLLAMQAQAQGGGTRRGQQQQAAYAAA
jgi:hypothetical protein